MRNIKRSVIAAAIAALTLSDIAVAETPALAPGKPAGVRHAQMIDDNTLLGLGLAAVAIGITIGLSSGSGNSGSAVVSSTSTTS